LTVSVTQGTVSVHRQLTGPGRSAAFRRRTTTRGGRTSASVSVNGKTLVDLPTRHADEVVAERPPSAANRGASTTVDASPQTLVDLPTRHAGEVVAERPPSGQRIDRVHYSGNTVPTPPTVVDPPPRRPLPVNQRRMASS
jgi:hypothetical protein